MPARFQPAAGAPRADATKCVRRQFRRLSFDVSSSDLRPFKPFRPSLVRGDTPRNAPLVYASVCARPQLPCQRPGGNATVHAGFELAVAPSLPMQPCLRDSSLPPTPLCVRGSRSSNHESRVTNHGRSGPPLCGGTPPATPPCSYASVRARSQLTCQRPVRNATVRAGFELAAAPSVPMPPCLLDSSLPSTPPCVRGARSSNHESRVTNHGRSGRSGPPLCGGTPPATPPLKPRQPGAGSKVARRDQRPSAPLQIIVRRGHSRGRPCACPSPFSQPVSSFSHRCMNSPPDDPTPIEGCTRGQSAAGRSVRNMVDSTKIGPTVQIGCIAP